MFLMILCIYAAALVGILIWMFIKYRIEVRKERLRNWDHECTVAVRKENRRERDV